MPLVEQIQKVFQGIIENINKNDETIYYYNVIRDTYMTQIPIHGLMAMILLIITTK